MKLLIISSLSMVFSSLSIAAPVSRLVCATSHLTTSYSLVELEGHFELQVAHHNGVEFMPIHEGLITIHDLSLLQEWAEVYKKMGPRFTLILDKSDCHLKDKEWSCFHNQSTQIGHLWVNNLSFKITPKRVMTSKMDQKIHRVLFSFQMDQNIYDLPMEYQESDCLFRNP